MTARFAAEIYICIVGPSIALMGISALSLISRWIKCPGYDIDLRDVDFRHFAGNQCIQSAIAFDEVNPNDSGSVNISGMILT